MPAAEIIAIGTELLLGEKQDTNTQFIARGLRDMGVDLYRTMMIGDNIERIACAIEEALQRADIVITTGGLGPTVDDPTRQAVALALGQQLVYREELWHQILDRFNRWGREPTENNRRQAFLPEGAVAISNPVGTAPAFQVVVGEKTIISLPGVPKEMEELFAHDVPQILRERYGLDQILVTYTIHVTGMGESQVDDLIADLETLSNPTVGLLAHAGQIDIRLAAKGADDLDALERIMPVVCEIRSRLGDNIFGEQDQTLDDVVAGLLTRSNHRLRIFESGMDGALVGRLSFLPGLDIIKLADNLTLEELKQAIVQQTQPGDMCVILGSSVHEDHEIFEIHTAVGIDGFIEYKTRSYGGPPANASIFAATISIDFLRRKLLQQNISP